MREFAVNILKSESCNLLTIFEKLEAEISGLGIDLAEEKNLKKLAKLICSDEIYQKIFWGHFMDSNLN